MTSLEELINNIDDDYLIGISNKGIVKRAYKDIENTEVIITNTGNSEVLIQYNIENDANIIQVKVGEEQVTITTPITESTCSCPSRSMCKHRVMAIIATKKLIEEKVNANKNKTLEQIEALEDRQDTITTENNLSSFKNQSLATKLLEEIKTADLHKLIKAITQKRLKNFINTIDNKESYDITNGQVITVKLNDYDHIVKLIYPLKDSVCTCHKSEICVHKAIAIIKCKYDEKMIKKEDILSLIEEKKEYDIDLIKATANSIIKNIEEIMRIGLTRVPKDIVDNFERTAILCHNAKLARQENLSRAISRQYVSYFAKVLTFDVEKLLSNIASLYEDMNTLSNEEDLLMISKVAGEFRSEYIDIGNLSLLGVAYEHYVTQNGYECEKVYFLDKETLSWFTVTEMTPVFYREEKGASPVYSTANMLNYNLWGKNNDKYMWGMSETIKSLADYELELAYAKSDDNNRLSQSKETVGKVIGVRKFKKELLEGIYYESFDKLFIEHIKENELSVNGENVFIKPYDLIKLPFDDKKQELKVEVYDNSGYRIIIVLKYDLYTKDLINELKQIDLTKESVIFGRIYLKNGELYMYPIRILYKWEFE